MTYGSKAFCKLCGGLLEPRDLGFMPTHDCKKSKN